MMESRKFSPKQIFKQTPEQMTHELTVKGGNFSPSPPFHMT